MADRPTTRNRLREMVCAGQLALAVAQRELARNWVAVYRRLYP
jgi:hypothetical protein